MFRGPCFSPSGANPPPQKGSPQIGRSLHPVFFFFFFPSAIYKDFDQMRRGKEAFPPPFFFLPSGVTKSGAEERGAAKGS